MCPLSGSPQINQATHDQALVLQNALQNIPNPSAECMLRNVAIRLAQQISDEVYLKGSTHLQTVNTLWVFLDHSLEDLFFRLT